MKLLIIVKSGCGEEFTHKEVNMNYGGALLHCMGLLNRNGDAWKAMIFDIDKGRRVYSILA